METGANVKLIKLGDSIGYQRLFRKEDGTYGLKSGHVILEPGRNIGEHSTQDREEAIVVIKGQGVAIINKTERLKMQENCVVYIPPKTLHDIKNTGAKKLEYVFITSQALFIEK